MNDPINLRLTTVKDPVPDFIYEGLRDYVRSSNSYHSQPKELVERLAKKFKVSPEMIFLTAGSDEAIQLLAKGYGANTFAFTPTYLVYSDAKIFGGNFTEINSLKDDTYSINPQKIEKATLIFLANPNNPAGFTVKERVMVLVKENSHAIVAIDETYGEFNDLSVISEIESHPNMAVIRSFSKDYGLAGARIGCLIASSNIIKKIAPFNQWANVSYLSVGAALVALNHEEYYKKMREEIIKRREDFYQFLKKNNFKVISSKINTVLLRFETEDQAKKFTIFLNKHNILVNQGGGISNIGLSLKFVRIAIGTNEQMELVKEIISHYKNENQ